MTTKGLMIISFSLFTMLMLSILPLPSSNVWWRPEWVLIMTLFWAIACPQYVSVTVAWCLGLLMDSLHGTLLGEQAFAMVLCVYLVQRLHQPISTLPLWQQSLAIFALVLLYRLTLLLIHGMLGDVELHRLFWLPAVTSVLVWPWIYFLFRDNKKWFVQYS